eukprot:12555752-Alexandrium_andersonii.AAC.1
MGVRATGPVAWPGAFLTRRPERPEPLLVATRWAQCSIGQSHTCHIGRATFGRDHCHHYIRTPTHGRTSTPPAGAA